MQLLESQPERPPRRETARWKKALFYLGLVVLIVGLNYLAARNEGRQKREAPARAESSANRESPKPDKPSDQPRTDIDGRSESRKSPNAGGKQESGKSSPPPAAKTKSTSRNETQPPTDDGDDGQIVGNMRIRGEDGRIVYSGDVDLRPTLDRIERGQRLRFPNDGSVFENRERRLPAKPSGYYHEYVLPTRGDDGPGPQRIVTGRDGEAYYTPDHYRTFRRIR